MAELESWMSTAARLGGWLIRQRIPARDFVPPQRALILKPCCMSQVMLATPLLQVLREGYPAARFDWAVSDWARAAVATHPAVGELLDSGRVGLPDCSWGELQEFIEKIKGQAYDTCFIPSRSSVLSYAAWRAGIPQRIGLDVDGRGFAHTMRVRPPQDVSTAGAYLSLAGALGLASEGARMGFYPTDEQRNAIFARLTEEIGWDGARPIVVLHPGGGRNPVERDELKRWPIERFALLGNHLVRSCNALVLVVGGPEEVKLAQGVAGIMSAEVLNLAGRISLGELGGLCELAALYVGNDAGPTHIAAAVGCATLVIYGPSSGEASRPPGRPEQVVVLWEPYEGVFSWEGGVSVARATAAAEALLGGRT